MKILAVGAHPDDIEILCAGALIRYQQNGHDVFMGSVCNGNKGHHTIPSEELAKIRLEEARQSADIIGAEHFCLDIPDCELFVDQPTMERVLELIRWAQPDVILTHAPNDYMPDHRAVSELVCQASFHATLPHYKSRNEPAEKIPPVFYIDTLAGVDFSPTDYVDVSAVFETKLAALRCHQSQRGWLENHDAIDMDDFVTVTARFRGLQCGAKYAEGFRKYQVWGRQASQRLLP